LPPVTASFSLGQDEGVELKDVVNLALHEFFERRNYLPEEAP
jgi:hypothetical protein